MIFHLDMAALTKEELIKKRQELAKDIEALDRVLRLFGVDESAPKYEPLSLTPPPVLDRPFPPAPGLKELVIDGLKLQQALGASPKDLLGYCKSKGYYFTSDVNGAASISTALSRLVDDEKVRKQDGRYYWAG